MSSENYRYYRLDADGNLHGAEWFHAGSDEEAVGHVETRHPNDRYEVWHGQRLVQQLDPYPTSDLLAGSERTLAEARRVLKETAHLIVPTVPQGGQGDAR
jgi:hypothetical protein